MSENLIEGCVQSLNDAGDLVTDISNQQCTEIDPLDQAKVAVGGHETIGIYPTDHNEPESTLIAVQGTSGHIEVGITGMNMSQMLGLAVGEKVKITW